MLTMTGFGVLKIHANPTLTLSSVNPNAPGHIAVGTNYTLKTTIFPDAGATPAFTNLWKNIDSAGWTPSPPYTQNFTNNGAGQPSAVTWTVVNQAACSVVWMSVGYEWTGGYLSTSNYHTLGVYLSP